MEKSNSQTEMLNENEVVENSTEFLKWKKYKKSDKGIYFTISLIIIALGFYVLSSNDYKITFWSLFWFGISVFIIYKVFTIKINAERFIQINKVKF